MRFRPFQIEAHMGAMASVEINRRMQSCVLCYGTKRGTEIPNSALHDRQDRQWGRAFQTKAAACEKQR